MALRRPPTRIELKADDVEEYDKIMKERRIAAERQATLEPSPHRAPSEFLGSALTSTSKKQSAAERIGYRRP